MAVSARVRRSSFGIGTDMRETGIRNVSGRSGMLLVAGEQRDRFQGRIVGLLSFTFCGLGTPNLVSGNQIFSQSVSSASKMRV